MSIICQVTQQARGKLRLDVPDLNKQPETQQVLMQLLCGAPGVTGVELQPASANIIVRYDGSPAARNTILQALRGGLAPDAHGTAVQPEPAATQTEAKPYARCEVVHAMRGRVRLHIPGAGEDAVLAGVLAMFLGAQLGVRHVRVNRRAGNVIVSYAPGTMTAASIAAMVAGYVPDAAAVARWRAQRLVEAAAPIQHGRRRKVEMALAAGALALILFGGAWATWIVFALLVGCAGSIVQRTYKSLRTDRRLVFDAMVAASMVAAGVLGALWVSAVIPLVLFGAPLVNAWAQARRSAAAPLPTQRWAVRKAVRAVAALPSSNSLFRLNPAHPTDAIPLYAALRPSEAPVPVNAQRVEVAQQGQMPTSTTVASNTTTFHGNATWFVYADVQHVAQRDHE